MSLFARSLATQWIEWLKDDPRLIVAAAILVLGLFVYGFRDLIRFSLGRTLAIAGVCFAESIRRRVLWLIPLGIAGVLLVSQFQRPLDDQDAVRQTTRFCLFAAGLLVTLATIILACTNLPREIDNRVIYSIVTKPTTRLEIILGKIAGFAAVSATILFIMAVFTWGFLHYHQWSLIRNIRQQLDSGSAPEASLSSLRYYADHGLLSARNYQAPGQPELFSRLPDPKSPLRWLNGGSEGRFLVPFELDPSTIDLTGNPDDPGLQINIHISDWRQRALNENEAAMASQLAATTMPAAAAAAFGPSLPSATTEPSSVNPPFVQVDILAQDQTMLLTSDALNHGKAAYVPSRQADDPARVLLTLAQTSQLARAGRIMVSVTPVSPGTEFCIGAQPVTMQYRTPQGMVALLKPVPGADGKPYRPIVIAAGNNPGAIQLRGAAENPPMSVVPFRGAKPESDDQGNAIFEFRCVIERSGETTEEMEQTTRVEFVVRNNATGESSSAIRIPVESRRATYFVVPAKFVSSDFDVLVRCATPGHWININGSSLLLSSANRSFSLNLAKSYFVLWLFSLLVVIISIFCSTFVSWPIAVVLTLVILLGHWGVQQIADTAKPGFGRSFANDLFKGAAAPVVETVSQSVEKLNVLLNFASQALPDVSRFAALESLEKGNAMPGAVIADSLLVLVFFGVPVIVLSYVFLRRKEVAP